MLKLILELLEVCEALLTAVNQTFETNAAVAVSFQAGAWPAFAKKVAAIRAAVTADTTPADPPAAKVPPPQWNQWQHHRHTRHLHSQSPTPAPAATLHRWKRGPWKAGRAP
jgi:hypothetical protein